MSAVIYAAIVVMWAVVLVPMWLRRHDAATESRSVDRFATAMRTLSRRTTSGPGRRYVVMPRRTEGGVSVHVSGAAAPPARPSTSRPSSRPAVAPASRPRRTVTARRSTSLVARRRRLLLGMLVVTFLTMVLAAAGVISWPLQIVVDVILVAFCIHLRAQAKRAAATTRQRRRAAVAPSTRRPVSRPAPARPTAPESAPAMPAAASADPLEATGTDDTWEPVPVPRPTYTLKAPAPVEVPAEAIDPLRDTDPYNAMTAVYDEQVALGSESIAVEEGEADSDLDEILTRRWAVND